MEASAIDIKISVIIPTYNMAQYIGECLDCVFQQTLSEIEVICVDDGSTDGTVQILRAYAAKKSNMHFFIQSHCYAGAARNMGIKHASGEFVTFLDADDLYECDDALATLYNEAKANNVLCCGGGMRNYWMDGSKVVGANMHSNLFNEDKKITMFEYQSPYGYITFIFDRKTLVKNDFFFPDYKKYEDPPFFCRFLMHVKKIFVLRKVVYHRRLIRKKYPLTDIEDILYGMIDVLEMVTEQRSQYGSLYSLILHDIKKYIKFLYLMAAQRKDKKVAYMDLLRRLRKTMQTIEDFKILRWEYNCLINEEWVLEQYQHIEEEKRHRLALIRNAKKIAIYGAGMLGMEYADYLVKILKKSVDCFVVSDLSNQSKRVNGIVVKDIYSLPDKEEYLIIVVMNEKWHDEVRSILSNFQIGATVYLGRDLIYDTTR